MRRPHATAFTTGAVAASVLAVVMIGVVASGMPAGPQLPLPWNQRDTVKVQLVDADGLAPHSSVEVAGVKVGEVQSVGAQGNRALATLTIEGRFADIHTDATVYLRTHGLFGPKYIAIDPGTTHAARVGDGATLGVNRSVQPVDLDAILQDLQAPEQQKLRTFIVEFGRAAAGKGNDVNHLFAAADSLTQVLDAPLRAVDDVAAQLSDTLVKDESFNSDFAQTPLDQLIANSESTFKEFAANATHLRSLLAHANSALTQVGAALDGNGASNLATVISALAQRGGTLDRVNEFTYLLGLYGSSLTGRDHSDSHDLDVTKGVIGAIENVRSAFASGEPCPQSTPVPGMSTLDNHCRSVAAPDAVRADGTLYWDGLQHYLRVQVANFAPNALGGMSQLCTLPVSGAPSLTCPQNASLSASPDAGMLVDDLTAFGALFTS